MTERVYATLQRGARGAGGAHSDEIRIGTRDVTVRGAVRRMASISRWRRDETTGRYDCVQAGVCIGPRELPRVIKALQDAAEEIAK